MPERILLFVPMYNCERQISRVIAQLTPEIQQVLSEVIVVDNRSSDNGRRVASEALAALKIPARLVMNDNNYGLGGSHKVAFTYALENGFDYLIVLHGDDQGSIADLVPYINRGDHRSLDALLGARFMTGAKLEGYSAFRTFGNHVFNTLYSLVAGYAIKDLGSGLNLYSVPALADRWWLNNANDLTFNYHMILKSINAGWKMRFFPLTWRESDQVSNVKLFRQALTVMGIVFTYLVARGKYVTMDYSGRPTGNYPSTTVSENCP